MEGAVKRTDRLFCLPIGDVEPDEDLRQVIDLQFKLLRAMVESKPAAVIESP